MELAFYNRYGVLAGRIPTHIYLRPHPALDPFVSHYTLCLGERPAPAGPLPPLRLIPDASGCLVFSLGPSGLEGRLYGPTTRLVVVANDLCCNPFRFFVEFRPGGLRAFTPIPQEELADRVLPLADAAPRLDELARRCWRQAADVDGFAAGLDQGLGALCTGGGVLSPLLARPLEGCAAPLSALARRTGYSPRHLSRLFRAELGMGPKRFAQVMRINAAVRGIRAGAPSLTGLAQSLGYFDQSHFIHAFRAVCGVSPTAYREGLSGFYNEPLKF